MADSDALTRFVYLSGSFAIARTAGRAAHVLTQKRFPRAAPHLAVVAEVLATLIGLGLTRVSNKMRPYEAEIISGAALAAATGAAQAYMPPLGGVLMTGEPARFPALPPAGVPRPPPRPLPPAEEKVGSLNLPLEDDMGLDGDALDDLALDLD